MYPLGCKRSISLLMFIGLGAIILEWTQDLSYRLSYPIGNHTWANFLDEANQLSSQITNTCQRSTQASVQPPQHRYGGQTTEIAVLGLFLAHCGVGFTLFCKIRCKPIVRRWNQLQLVFAVRDKSGGPNFAKTEI